MSTPASLGSPTAQDIVNQLKKEGKFDELRKQILAKIVADGKITYITKDAGYEANKYLDNLALPCTIPENELSATLRNRLDRCGVYNAIDPVVSKVLQYDVEFKQLIMDLVQQTLAQSSQ